MPSWDDQTIEEFRAKRGRGIGHFGDRLLLLTTKGARTGVARTHPVAYHRDGDGYVVAATKGGAPTSPDWYHNLRKHPDVQVEIGDESFPARARITTGDERTRLYEAHAKAMPDLGFPEYPKKTKRVIPVVILERAR